MRNRLIASIRSLDYRIFRSPASGVHSRVDGWKRVNARLLVVLQVRNVVRLLCLLDYALTCGVEVVLEAFFYRLVVMLFLEGYCAA